MKDLKLDIETHDLDVNFVWADGWEGVTQQIRIRLLTFLGEYFLDLEAGLPWRQLILVKAPDVEAIKAVIRASVADVPGVLAVTTVGAVYDASQRVLALSFTAVIEDDSTSDAGGSTRVQVTTNLGLDDGSSLLLLDYDSYIIS